MGKKEVLLGLTISLTARFLHAQQQVWALGIAQFSPRVSRH